MGFALFAVLMALFMLLCVPMQRTWGITGLAATEGVFLVLALAYALVLRIPLKEMFPVRKFTLREFFGSLSLAFGGMLLGLISIALTALIYPGALAGRDVQALNDYMDGSSGYLFPVLVIAVMPAVCEEAVHRGAILSNFRTIKKDWLIVLIMSLFFGIFHISVLRFISSAVMGACLTYAAVKKNNILLSSLMHFILNLTSVTLSLLSAGTSGGVTASSVQSAADAMKTALGMYLMAGAAAPFLIVTGMMLLDPAAHKKIRFLFAGIISVVMLVSSFAVAMTSGPDTIVQTNMSYTVGKEYTDSSPVVFNVAEEGDYTVTVVVMNASGEYSVRIETDDGDHVADGQISPGKAKIYSRQTEFEPGDYRLCVVNGSGRRGEKPAVSVQIAKK